ncbi:MAG TPA: acyl-CoA dehydrogenase family protein [Candidatus Binatia bacterium]|nr:acyl-CoA dehydrogenase family protein [Candidatus Binatia bacterium]
MDFGLSSDQLMLKDTIKRFLDEQCPTTRVRAIMESDSGHDPKLWNGLAELGITGLIIPTAQGGSGLELLDLALAAEELGYAACPGPFLGSSLATVALVEGGDAAQREQWLPKIAAGKALATIAIGEEDSRWDPAMLTAKVVDGKLSGAKPLVPYASSADVFIVAAHGDDGPGLWLVERGAPGIEINTLKLIDMTRHVESVTFRNTPATALGGAKTALQRTIDAGCILIAADAYGGSRRCLSMTVDYAMQREQFGQKIAAFQAVKHQLANLASEIEPSLSLYWYAAHAFDHIRDQSERHAAIAKAHLSDLFDRATRDCTELHGGIGFTWEFDLHLWFRRAVFDRGFLGEANYHRERAAKLAGW